MQFVDTHCHIHFPDYQLSADEVRQAAAQAGVTRLICVGCTLADSELAVAYAARHEGVWASIGLHPHEAKVYVDDERALQQFRNLAGKAKVVAIGETGLDYHYNHSSPEDQKRLLRFQLTVAAEHNLPVIFHVREAFDDFWPIFDEFKGVRGIVHSFTASQKELDQIVARGLYIGLNGIMTFTKHPEQLAAAKSAPLERILIETDAPFLTPHPSRGKICEPRHVVVTAKFLADLRGESLQSFAEATTHSARTLFKI